MTSNSKAIFNPPFENPSPITFPEITDNAMIQIEILRLSSHSFINNTEDLTLQRKSYQQMIIKNQKVLASV